MSQCLDVLLADAEHHYTKAAAAFAAITAALKHQRGIERGDPHAIAFEQARNELLSTPAVISEWLNHECMRHTRPMSTDKSARDTACINVPQLLAFAFGAPTHEAREAALAHLRDSFCTAYRSVIEERAEGNIQC